MLKKLAVALVIVLSITACSKSMTSEEKMVIDKRVSNGEASLSTDEREIFEKAIVEKPDAKKYAQEQMSKRSFDSFGKTPVSAKPLDSFPVQTGETGK